jgi:hypothetical protein
MITAVSSLRRLVLSVICIISAVSSCDYFKHFLDAIINQSIFLSIATAAERGVISATADIGHAGSLVNFSSLRQLTGLLCRYTFTTGTATNTLLNHFTAATVQAFNRPGGSILRRR